MTHLLPYIADNLEKHQIRYEIHRFDSGAVMVDLWVNDNFHVVQIDDHSIGLSLITNDTMPFDTIPDVSFTDESAFKSAFEKILSVYQSVEKKVLVIDGMNFQTLDEFYAEVDKVLTKDLDWQTGHNLAAFNDLLRGGFGVHEYEEPIILIWKNSAKSRRDLSAVSESETLYEYIISIIKGHEHIEFIEQ